MELLVRWGGKPPCQPEDCLVLRSDYTSLEYFRGVGFAYFT